MKLGTLEKGTCIGPQYHITRASVLDITEAGDLRNHVEPRHKPVTEARYIQKHVHPHHKTPSKRADTEVRDIQLNSKRDESKTPNLSLQARGDETTEMYQVRTRATQEGTREVGW